MIGYAYPDADLTGELTLDELLSDPIIRLLMRRDGVEESEMRRTLNRVHDSYRALTEAQ
jgi:hypothetical protein